MIFASILVPKTFPKSADGTRPFFDIFLETRPTCPQDAPRRVQDASKTPPRRLEDPQDAPRQLKDASNLPQTALKHPKSAIKTK